MTREEARNLLAMIEIKEPNEFIVNSWWGSFVNDYKEALQMAIQALEQQPHNAEFVPSRDGYEGHVTCTNCFKIYDWDSEAQYFNYCPKCGAYMRGDKE